MLIAGEKCPLCDSTHLLEEKPLPPLPIQEGPSITALCEDAYRTAMYHGFHEIPINYGLQICARHILSLLMLVTTEVAEAAEAVRRGDPKEEFAEELADVCFRVFDLAKALDLDLEGAVLRKMDKNRTRPWKHGGKLV